MKIDVSIDNNHLSKSKKLLNVVLTYGLAFDNYRLEWVTIESTKFNEQNNPCSWAVRKSSTCMSKFSGSFDYEPMPSSRDDEFFNTYRFSTPEEAAECWLKHYDTTESKSSNLSIQFAEWLSENEWIKRTATHPNKVGKYYSHKHCEYKTIEELFDIFSILK